MTGENHVAKQKNNPDAVFSSADNLFSFVCSNECFLCDKIIDLCQAYRICLTIKLLIKVVECVFLLAYFYLKIWYWWWHTTIIMI